MVEIEKQVIGTFLNNQSLSLIDTLSEEDFLIMTPVFRGIKSSLKNKKHVNPILVSKKCGIDLGDIKNIMEEVFTFANIEGNIELLKKEAAKRKYQAILSEPIKEDIEIAIAEKIKKLQEIKITTSHVSETLKDACIDFMKVLDERTKNKGKEMYIDIPTFDRLTAGLHKKELTCIGARPGQGKTTFGLQIAYAVAKKDKKVLFVSLEMSKIQIAERYITRFSDVPHEDLRLGNIKDYNSLYVALDIKGFGNIVIDTATRTVDQLRLKIVNLKPDLVVIDYVGLIRDPGKFDSRRAEVSSITRKLKLMTLDFDIPIVMLAQLGRTAQNKKPILSELRDSGSLEEDSDNVIFIHRLSEEEMKKELNFESCRVNHYLNKGEHPSYIIIEKQRNGDTKIIPTIFEPTKFTFTELKKG